MAWANDAARSLCGVHALTPDPHGGELGRHADGHPTGLLKCAWFAQPAGMAGSFAHRGTLPGLTGGAIAIAGTRRCGWSASACPRSPWRRSARPCWTPRSCCCRTVLGPAQRLHAACARPTRPSHACASLPNGASRHVTRCLALRRRMVQCQRRRMSAVDGSHSSSAAGQRRRRDDGYGHGLRAAVGHGVLGGPARGPGAAGRRGAAAATHSGLPAAAGLVTPARGPAPAPGLLAAPGAGRARG